MSFKTLFPVLLELLVLVPLEPLLDVDEGVELVGAIIGDGLVVMVVDGVVTEEFVVVAGVVVTGVVVLDLFTIGAVSVLGDTFVSVVE